MIRQKLPRVIDRNKIEKLRKKTYRDAYIRAQVQAWIAYQLKALRAKFNISQYDMALKLGKPQSVVSRLENPDYGRMSVQTLLDIATSLDVALLVQFVSYPEFLARTENKSEAAMQPETIDESIFSLSDDVIFGSDTTQTAILSSRTSAAHQSILENRSGPLSGPSQDVKSVDYFSKGGAMSARLTTRIN